MRTLLVIILALFVIAGCSRNTQNSVTPLHNQSPNGTVHAQQTNPESYPKLQPKQIVTHLEKLATSIPQVQHAHCVIMGKTAIVGIDVKSDLPRSRVDNIKYSVAEALKKDPYGVNAIVTADMDLDRRLQNIRQEIMNGRPISGFADELGKIIGRIMPQLPRDVTAKTSPPPNATRNMPTATKNH